MLQSFRFLHCATPNLLKLLRRIKQAKVKLCQQLLVLELQIIQRDVSDASYQKSRLPEEMTIQYRQ